MAAAALEAQQPLTSSQFEGKPISRHRAADGSSLPTLAFAHGAASEAEVVSAVAAAARTGVLIVTGLTPAPFAEIRASLACVAGQPSLAARANTAYPQNLVWKDSFAQGKGGNGVDMKRVLDLSPHRLAAIMEHDPELCGQVPQLDAPLAWFADMERSVAPRLLAALSHASGCESIATEPSLCAYRMVDYYERPADAVPPRCGEHRDFGTATLICSDSPGLEVEIDGRWHPVPTSPGCGVLLFGWCTQIRSNDRFKAALHRVRNTADNGCGVVPARTSAVLFLAPQQQASLQPQVLPGEEQLYTYKTAGDLKGIMARKWRWREGTLSEEDATKEAAEVGQFPDQDSIVEHAVRRK